jgi:hypothetical protein
MAYNASVPADNLPIKDIPGAIREKGKELAAITEGYPPVVNADKVDGYDTSLEPAAHVILITDEDGKLPTGALDFASNVLVGDGLEIVAEDPEVDSVTIAMETPATCTLETENAFPESGGHTHKIEFPEGDAPNGAFVFYENFAGKALETFTAEYSLVKTFSITIPAAGVYLFGCGYNVVAWGSADVLTDCVKFTIDATMVIGWNTGAFSEERCRDRWVTGYTEQENPIYEYEAVGAKIPALNGRMLYFSSPGEKLLKVYMKGQSTFEISNVCVGVIGAGT